MGTSLDTLKTAVEELSPLSPQAWEAFSSIWQPLSISKKQVISPSYTIESYFYFNLDGILRLVHHNEDGNETTIEFILGGTFSGYLDREQRLKPSPFALQTLTHSKLMRCLYTDLEALIIQYPEIERFICKILSRRIEALLNHLVIVRCCNSQEKYYRIVTEAPELMQLVSQKYIANHLGIHATNFSKYKKIKQWHRN